MGIQRLTKHLLPFAEPVVLRDTQNQDPSTKGSICIDSVVIDGPSLVYYVFSRLLSWTDPTVNVLDAQPTCHEVSVGVMMCLLQLMCSGIGVHKICFDGALPVPKRETRVSRLEKSRKKLELLRSPTQRVSTAPKSPRPGFQIDPGKLLSARSLPARYKDFPENPFMVSAVFEDLKYRWNRQAIADAIRDYLSFDLTELDDYPLASRTVMLPGEADVECAQISRLTGCAILTNDSDLLLYDLGADGSVVFLNSMELNSWTSLNPAHSSIKAERICPAVLARQLGIANVQRFAYELNTNPRLGLAELIQQSRDTELTPGYRLFTQEYQSDLSHRVIDDSSRQLSQSLDTRVSEVFWQYKLPDIYMSGGAPHVYLGILNEDHARKCAWEHGRLYRGLAYSILNASCPPPARFSLIHEYIRRGGRIAVDRITLGNSEQIAAEMKSVCERLTTAQSVFGGYFASPSSWTAFALCEVYLPKATMQGYLPNAEQLRRFFRFGYMEKDLDWPDIHLFAEIQAVLYSVRILKQLLEAVGYDGEFALQIRAILTGLPPLHGLMRSRHEMTWDDHSYNADGFEDRFFQLWERTFEAKPSETRISSSLLSQEQSESNPRTKRRMEKQGGSNAQKRPSNIYEFLSQQ